MLYTPPARDDWHHVPAGQIHHGTFTEVYGFEFRPGWAYRCGDCPEVGVGYSQPPAAADGATRHRDRVHPSAEVVELPTPPRSGALAVLTPHEWVTLRAKSASVR